MQWRTAMLRRMKNSETVSEIQVILVTKDLVLRLKAQILGIKAEDFEREQISDDDPLPLLIKVMMREIISYRNSMKTNL